MGRRRAVDLDGTLCAEGKASERMFAVPNFDLRDRVNRLMESGDEVFIYTARPWADYRMTHDWLVKHGFRFTALVCGKLNYDDLLDDRATNNPKEFFGE